MTAESRVRFLRSIAESVAPESVEEVQVFTPRRQGGWESGVAVVAARSAPPEGSGSSPERQRLTIYTARYRWAMKGPERGRWETAVSAEADAPLETVDEVVRGVQQRSGDAQPPERLPGERFRAALLEEPCPAAGK